MVSIRGTRTGVAWLPKRWFRHSLRARNYWPRELIALVEDTGFTVRHSQSVFPMFDHFRWLPSPLIRHIRRSPDSLARAPIVRKMGVSTMVIAQRES
jgi:hypothetical protein